jgi:hypothetical protein
MWSLKAFWDTFKVPLGALRLKLTILLKVKINEKETPRESFIDSQKAESPILMEDSRDTRP